MTLDDFLSKLVAVKKSGKGYVARCPAHDDHKASLSISEGDGGRILLHCHAGCLFEAITSVLGIGAGDMFAEPLATPQRNGRPRIVKVYDYRDEQGQLLYQVVRYEPKDFRQRRPDGHGTSWTWNLNGVRRVLYRLPELLAANPQATVFVGEGEKDSDRLRGRGLVSTSNSGGAGSEKNNFNWLPEYNEHLRGREVVILPDNDDAGRAHAQAVARSLHGIASSIKVLALPGLPEKGDISDWLDAGGSVEALCAMVDDVAEWKPESADGQTADPAIGEEPRAIEPQAKKTKYEPLRGRILAEIEEVELDYIWKPWLPKLPSLVVGEEGIGKSLFLIYVMQKITTGSPFHGGHIPEKGKVMVFSAEDYADSVIKPRARVAGVDMSQVLIFEEPFWLNQVGLARLAEAVEFYKPVWVYFDPVLAYFPPGLNPNNPADVRSITTQLAHICREQGCGSTCLLHLNKSKGEGDARKAVSTSGEWRNSARSVIYVGAHPDDRSKRAIYRRKTNHAAEQLNGLAFEIIGVPDDTASLDETGNRRTLPLFHILGESTMSLEQTLGSTRPEEGEATAIEDAVRFLQDELKNSPIHSKQVYEDGKGLGISDATVRRAIKKISVESHQVWDPNLNRQRWFLCLAGRWPKDTTKLIRKVKKTASGKAQGEAGPGDHVGDPDAYIPPDAHRSVNDNSKNTLHNDLPPGAHAGGDEHQGQGDAHLGQPNGQAKIVDFPHKHTAAPPVIEDQEPGASSAENWGDEEPPAAPEPEERLSGIMQNLTDPNRTGRAKL